MNETENDNAKNDKPRRSVAGKSLSSKASKLRIRLTILLAALAVSLAILFTPGAPALLRGCIYAILPTSPFELRLSGPPKEMGKIHGKARGFAIRLLCDLYLERIVCRDNKTLLSNRSAAAKKLFSRIPRRWSEEIAGLSETSGVPEEELMLANSFLDLGFDRCGCRQIVISGHSANGRPILLHAHNLDWSNLGGVGNFLVTIFRTEHTPNRLATVHIAFPGMLGALTIINENGISLGFNQRGFSKGATEMPVFLEIRNIAETAKSFAEARKRILAMPSGMPFFIMLADAKSGKGAVFEREGTIVTERDMKDGVIAADNKSWFGAPHGSCPAERVAIELSRRGDAPLTAMKKTLRDSQVLLACNIYSVIFDFNDNAFYLASGEIPAAKGIYRKFILFNKDRK